VYKSFEKNIYKIIFYLCSYFCYNAIVIKKFFDYKLFHFVVDEHKETKKEYNLFLNFYRCMEEYKKQNSNAGKL